MQKLQNLDRIALDIDGQSELVMVHFRNAQEQDGDLRGG